jgi:hypothetical protein
MPCLHHHGAPSKFQCPYCASGSTPGNAFKAPLVMPHLPAQPYGTGVALKFSFLFVTPDAKDTRRKKSTRFMVQPSLAKVP